ncbi:MIB [Mytilus coruscus]|uniref:MIB n=1 Tax=Mytilus coruscus TaxID=42192 RepID=A0A6J8BQ82_MYTCO|nr:MIB [Mytilus coruscus]
MNEYGISLEKRLNSVLGRRRTYYEDSDDEDTEDSDSDKEIDNTEKDIQKDPCIKEKFSFYSNFHGYPIRKHYGGEKIKSGLRVIRSRSWIPPEDYIHDKEDREIGTITNVAKGGVKVQWDSLDGIDTCVKGENGQFNLLLFDNAQIGVMHSHVQCDGCGENPLRGIRWKCRNCINYNLCTRCYMEDEHDSNGHKFKRIQSENAKGEKMMSRSALDDYIIAIGIGKGATVKLRSDDKHAGIVQELQDKKIKAFRSDAKVKWSDCEARYAVGTDGKCDLKFTKEGKGPMYYADHLPVVSNEGHSGCIVLHYLMRDRYPGLHAADLDQEEGHGNIIPGAWRQNAMHEVNQVVGPQVTKEGKQISVYLKNFYNNEQGRLRWQDAII